MPDPRLTILTVGAGDRGGGAAEVGHALTRAYAVRGYRSLSLVGHRRGSDADTMELPDGGKGPGWAHTMLAARDSLVPLLGRMRGAGRLHELLHVVGRPRRIIDRWRGVEDWTLPASWHVLDLVPERPDVVQCHNLHSFRDPLGHFDLRALVPLTRHVPVVLTLHDAWLTTGHCAHPLECERWTTGCGACPDLGLFPAVRRDATATNWRRKREVFAECRFFVASPCKWLMDRVRRSILAPTIIESRVIPNGVDTNVFRPGDRSLARSRLGLPADAAILMFSAPGTLNDSFKDFGTLRQAMHRIGRDMGERRILLLALGAPSETEHVGAVEIRHLPFQEDRSRVADYLRAADMYVHAAHVETFPLAVLEAMATGTPVVATAVGGIPEQVSAETGVLVPAHDAEALGDAVERLLRDADMRHRLGENAAREARDRFGLDRQADAYLDWFREIVAGAGPGP